MVAPCSLAQSRITRQCRVTKGSLELATDEWSALAGAVGTYTRLVAAPPDGALLAPLVAPGLWPESRGARACGCQDVMVLQRLYPEDLRARWPGTLGLTEDP